MREAAVKTPAVNNATNGALQQHSSGLARNGKADVFQSQEVVISPEITLADSMLESVEIARDAEAAIVPGARTEDAARRKIAELIENTKTARPTTDTDLLMRAYAFAQEKHEGQFRNTGEPYIEHPIAVSGILAELGMDDPTIAAGLLHDVPEDCDVSYEEMVRHFGAEVAQLVDGVTKLRKIDFNDKQEKQAENLRKLFLAMAGDVRVIIVKLADRLHNMRTIEGHKDPKKREEVAKETLQIFAPIAHRLGIWRIKWELEDRSFKYTNPEEYRQIYEKVRRTRAERSALVQRCINTLNEHLQEQGIEAEVTGRPKHFYSIYQKMIKQGLKFDAIHDLIALRVICNTNSDCYHALGIVHMLWSQVPEMFFDYIGKPKPNGYQSLHTKVLVEGGDVIEVQIRTKEMHRHAEFGIAAHWRYKESDKPAQNWGDKLRWLRLVLEIDSDTAGNASEFLDSLRLDVSHEQIFAFTPKGDAIYLPQDSTPVDFAYRIHSEVGFRCTGARVNGRIVPLSYKLHNGDICEIITSRASTGPKRDWLDWVVTPHAKNRIRSHLKRQNFDENFKEGVARIEKAAQSERLKLGALVDNESIKATAQHMKFKNAQELIAAVGYGEVSAEHVVNRAKADLKEAKPESKSRIIGASDDTLSGRAASLMQKRPKFGEEPQDIEGTLEFSIPADGAPTGRASGRTAKGQSDLLYTLARCCAPIPGDEIRGYITRGRGVSVHRADCANLKQYEEKEPNRLVMARWTGISDKPFQALVALECSDRPGLLRDVTAIIAAHEVNICGVNTYPLKNNRARLNIAVTIVGVEKLNEVMNALRSVPGTMDVHRV
jgi:GTP diphosphokinase / guanosine-3',5'-bis(diphosphate) 3'-diphosphatase